MAGAATSTSSGTRRRRARAGEGDRLREEILAATRELIQQGGEEAVSLRAVAEAVGITTPSIYLHFADRTDLVFAACETLWAELGQRLDAALAAHDDVPARLRAAAHAYVGFALERPHVYRVLFMSGADEQPERMDMAEFLTKDGGLASVLEAVTRGIDEGVLRGEAIDVAFVLWSAVHGVASLHITCEDVPLPSPDVLADRMCDALLDGLRARP